MTPPKGSPVARTGEGNVGFRFRAGGDPAGGDTHRSVYLPIVRDGVPEVFTLFDFPDPSLIIGERATTTIPAVDGFVCTEHAIQYWQALVLFAVQRPISPAIVSIDIPRAPRKPAQPAAPPRREAPAESDRESCALGLRAAS